MHLNFFNLIQLCIEDESSILTNYLRHEYGLFEIDPVAAKTPDLVIAITNDVVEPENIVTIRPPVAYDALGVFFHDPSYRVFRIDFQQLGFNRGCRLTCDRSFNPHFFAIIIEYLLNFLMAEKGWIFCHSSAFVFRKKVIVCPAWRNVGKTNLLLWFLQNGAQYLADDWCLLSRRGEIRSLPKRMNLLYHNFKENQELLNSLPEKFIALFDFVRRCETGEYDLNQATMNELKEQARLRLSPYEVFGQRPTFDPLKIDYVFFLQRSVLGSTEVSVDAIEHATLVKSLLAIHAFEQSYFQMAYDAYKGCGGQPNPILERSQTTSYDIMHSAFANDVLLKRLMLPSQSSTRLAGQRIQDFIGSG